MGAAAYSSAKVNVQPHKIFRGFELVDNFFSSISVSRVGYVKVSPCSRFTYSSRALSATHSHPPGAPVRFFCSVQTNQLNR
jgi:hypothetical protein